MRLAMARLKCIRTNNGTSSKFANFFAPWGSPGGKWCHQPTYKRHPCPHCSECGPGEDAQVDFGTGAPVITADGKRRKTHVFRIVLSHSRKGYSEPTFTQTTDDFLHQGNRTLTL